MIQGLNNSLNNAYHAYSNVSSAKNTYGKIYNGAKEIEKMTPQGSGLQKLMGQGEQGAAIAAAIAALAA